MRRSLASLLLALAVLPVHAVDYVVPDDFPTVQGDALPLPPFPLTPPVAVQLRTDAGECWGATYSAPSLNDMNGLTGRND
jgi:hypothetical protein